MSSDSHTHVSFIHKKKRRHRSFEFHPDRVSTTKPDTNSIVHVKIGLNHNTHSLTDKIKLNSTPSSSSVNLTVLNRRNRSNNQRNINQQQFSTSCLTETKVTSEHHQNSKQKHRCFCVPHLSLPRALLFLVTAVLLCIALSALIVSLLTRSKDTTITRSMVSILWTFDNNTNDIYNVYNGISVNAPSYGTSYTGLDNKALYLNGSLSQYIKVNDPLLEFTYRSFTIEMWFYPTLLTTADFGLFGQCETMEKDRCLMLMIRNYCVYFSFYDDDLSGTTTLLTNRWYHVAFVYDYTTSTQLLYLNGYLESSQTSNKYQGATKSMTIGAVKTGPSDFFFGYIDQVSLITSVKSTSEILYDATFVCQYSFDTSAYVDSGPWNFIGSNIGLSSSISTGYIGNAVSFTSANTYFLFGGLSLLGTSDQSYSMALWIKPTSVTGGSIIYVSKCDNNCASNWCMPFTGFTLAGQIVIQSFSSSSGGTLITLLGPTIFTNVWTHIVYTYSSTNGMRLYLNGLLFQQSSIFSYMGSGSSNYIYLGSFPLTTCAGQASGIISATQYYGTIDEYYVYARELTATEVSVLANA